MNTRIVIALSALTLATPAIADDPGCPGPGPCNGAWGGPGFRGPEGRGPRARAYDPKTVATVAGKVAAVTTAGRRGRGVHVDLETAEGLLPVRIGPAWFLEKEGLQIAAGDQIEVTGSRIAWDGKQALVAQVVKKGSTAVALRDLDGVPVWARRGHR